MSSRTCFSILANCSCAVLSSSSDCMRYVLWGFENGDHGRERRGLLAVAEFQASTYKADFCGAVIDPIMEPPRISAAMGQHHYGSAVECSVVAFARPSPHLFSVWRI